MNMTKEGAMAAIANFTSQAALAMQNAKNVAQAHGLPFNQTAYDALCPNLGEDDWLDSCSMEDNWNSSDVCW